MPLTPSKHDPNRESEMKRRSKEPDTFNDPNHAASPVGKQEQRPNRPQK